MLVLLFHGLEGGSMRQSRLIEGSETDRVAERMKSRWVRTRMGGQVLRRINQGVQDIYMYGTRFDRVYRGTPVRELTATSGGWTCCLPNDFDISDS